MRAPRKIVALVQMLLVLGGLALAQDRQNNLAERQKAPTVLGGTGLFNTFSTRTLSKGEFNFAIFWNNFNRNPGNLDINQVPFNFTLGLTDRWELWVNWVTWQQVTSRQPFLLSGYQYNAVRLFGDPVQILGPPVGGNGTAAFFPGTGATAGGILPAIGRFGAPANFTGASTISPAGPNGPQVIGLGPAIVSDLPGFYNDLPFFGLVDFLGFDPLGRPILGPRQSANGTSDVFAGTKYNIIDPNKSWFSLALGGYVKLPISRADQARARGRTSGEYEYGPIIMVGQESGGKRLRVYENIGYIHTGDIEKRGVKVLDLRDKLLMNVGASYAINKYAEFIGELAYTRYVGNGTPRLFENNPLDLTLGARFFLRNGAISFGGAYRHSWIDTDDRALSVLECVEVHHDPPPHKPYGCHDPKDCPPPPPPPPKIECRPRSLVFEGGEGHGFVGYFSIGTRKGCPLPPVPACVLEAGPTTVSRGERLTLTVRPTTTGYTDDQIDYGYRWDVRDAQGRPVALRGSGSTIEVPTSRLVCGSYSVTATITATLRGGFSDDCVTSGQATCAASFEVAEPPCPNVSCAITSSASSVIEGDRVTLRVSGSGEGNLAYEWSATGGRLSSRSGSEVTLDTRGVTGPVTITVSIRTDRTRCDEPCPGASCSTMVDVREVPPTERPPIIRPCGPIFFPFNSARVNNEHKACLDEIADRLLQDPRLTLIIDGHRDSSERVGISLTRANSARDYLVNEKRVAGGRIIIRNFSDTCPEVSRRPELNRRVEFWIIPEGASIDDVNRAKECATGSVPRVLTTEEAAPAAEPRPRRRTQRVRRPEPGASEDDDEGTTSAVETRPAAPSNRSSAAYANTGSDYSGSQLSLRPATIVHSVRNEVIDGVLRIVVSTDGETQFKAFTLTNPSRIVVDLAGVRLTSGSKTLQIGQANVGRVRVGEPGDGVVRIVLDINARVGYQIVRRGSSLIILVGDSDLLTRIGPAETVPIMIHQ